MVAFNDDEPSFVARKVCATVIEKNESHLTDKHIYIYIYRAGYVL